MKAAKEKVSFFIIFLIFYCFCITENGSLLEYILL